MIRAIFNVFRLGRAETLFDRDPFVLIQTFGTALTAGRDRASAAFRPDMVLRWVPSPTDGRPEMRWARSSDAEPTEFTPPRRTVVNTKRVAKPATAHKFQPPSSKLPPLCCACSR